MFSLLSESVVKQLADSGSLTPIKDQERIPGDFLSLIVWDCPCHQHICTALCVHAVDKRYLTQWTEVFMPMPFHMEVNTVFLGTLVSWRV